MMAIHYGHWGYFEFEDVRQALKDHLYELLDKPKVDIVDFYAHEYARQITSRATIQRMEANGVHVIDGGADEL